MIEGKTKVITRLYDGLYIGLVDAKNDITAGDGSKHNVIAGKAELATRTTCNVFEYLMSKGVPVSYIGRDGPTTFLTRICKMIPVEIVVRRIATGSYLKRHPQTKDLTRFKVPVVEFFYKTTGKQLCGDPLPCDDPLLVWNDIDSGYQLFFPNKPAHEGLIFKLSLPKEEAQFLHHQLQKCSEIALEVNRHLSNGWESLGGTIYDFKLEFGILPNGPIVLADVVDCDSWRVLWEGIQLSKQGYRDGDDLDRVLGVYRLAASLTDRLVSLD